MKILVDLTYIIPGVSTGVSVFAVRLIKGFEMYYDGFENDFFLLTTNENDKFVKNTFGNLKSISIPSSFVDKYKICKFTIQKKSIENFISSQKIDIFFSPYLHIKSLSLNSVKQIGVVHDVQPLVLKISFLKSIYKFIFKKLLVNRDLIITISEYSKNTIINNYPCVKSKIHVIYNSVECIENVNKTSLFETPYILYVNSILPYKNLITLVKAFNLIKDKIPHIIVVKGAKTMYWDKVIFPLIKSYKIEERVIIISENYNDLKMASLYKSSELFITPSLMEGFGFTPIEAAIYKTPVISSKETALYETTLGILNYYEPALDAQSLAEKILEMLSKPEDIKTLDLISDRMKEKYSLSVQVSSFIRKFKMVI